MLIIIFIVSLRLPLAGSGKAHIKSVLQKGHKLAVLVRSETVRAKKLDTLQEKEKSSDKFIPASDNIKHGALEPA